LVKDFGKIDLPPRIILNHATQTELKVKLVLIDVPSEVCARTAIVT